MPGEADELRGFGAGGNPDVTGFGSPTGATGRGISCQRSAEARVSQAAMAQLMTASRSARVAPSRACTDRPCTTVV